MYRCSSPSSLRWFRQIRIQRDDDVPASPPEAGGEGYGLSQIRSKRHGLHLVVLFSECHQHVRRSVGAAIVNEDTSYARPRRSSTPSVLV